MVAKEASSKAKFKPGTAPRKDLLGSASSAVSSTRILEANIDFYVIASPRSAMSPADTARAQVYISLDGSEFQAQSGLWA